MQNNPPTSPPVQPSAKWKIEFADGEDSEAEELELIKPVIESTADVEILDSPQSSDTEDEKEETKPQIEKKEIVERKYVGYRKSIAPNETILLKGTFIQELIAQKESAKKVTKQRIRDISRAAIADGNKNRNRISLWLQDLKQWWNRKSYRVAMLKWLFPLEGVIIDTERSFGTGVASYYRFAHQIIWLNVFLLFVFAVLIIIPWFFPISRETAFGAVAVGNVTYEKDWPKLGWPLAKGILGMDSEELGKTWFYYGGYPRAVKFIFESWNFGFVYPCTIIIFYAISLLIVVLAIGQRLYTVVEFDSTLVFSYTILSMWDYSLTSANAVGELKKAVASKLKELLKKEELRKFKKKKLSIMEWTILILRRTIGISVSIALIIGSPVCIWFIMANKQLIETTLFLPMAPSIMISAINSIFPMIVKFMVKLEGYEDPSIASYNTIGRTFFLKMVSIGFLLYRVLSFNDSTFTDPKRCFWNEAGMVFWQMLLIDLFVAPTLTIVPNLILNRLGSKLEFAVAQNVIDMLYRQALIWVGSLVCPMVPLLGTINNLILYFVKYFVMKWTCKFPEKPMTSSDASAFNFFFLLITLVFTMIPAYLFLIKEGGTVCGPCKSEDGKLTALESFQSIFLEGKQKGTDNIPIIGEIVNVLFEPFMLLVIAILFLILLYFAVQRLRMYQARLKHAMKTVSEERRDKMALLRQFGVLKSPGVAQEKHSPPNTKEMFESMDTKDKLPSEKLVKSKESGFGTIPKITVDAPK